MAGNRIALIPVWLAGGLIAVIVNTGWNSHSIARVFGHSGHGRSSRNRIWTNINSIMDRQLVDAGGHRASAIRVAATFVHTRIAHGWLCRAAAVCSVQSLVGSKLIAGRTGDRLWLPLGDVPDSLLLNSSRPCVCKGNGLPKRMLCSIVFRQWSPVVATLCSNDSLTRTVRD